jgi:hypothetical protein
VPDVKDLEAAVRALPPAALAEFRRWFAKFDSAAWDGTSINQFVSAAVAEKLAMLQAETYLRERAEHADLAVFDRILSRPGGQAPRLGDEA